MNLAEDVIRKYQAAGNIVREVRAEIRRFLREGMLTIAVCEKVEELIREKGGRPAFPCNVSVNEVAAHYTSPPDDVSIIPVNSIVKVDIGAQIEGYIADTAVTICFNPDYEVLVQASEEALGVAVKAIHAGMSTSKLGSIIQKAIKGYGCKPISNLTGHEIGRYLIHTGKSIPNVSHLVGSKIREGEVVALEPFVTVSNAAGKVRDGDMATIFRLVKRKSFKNSYAKQLSDYVEANFKTLPFSERWLKGVVPKENHFAAFRELLRSKCLKSYYVFIEVSGRPVAQAEHTVLIEKDGCTVLT